MDLTDTNTIVILAVVVLVLAVLLSLAVRRMQRSRRLKERFGPEYERMVEETGNKREVERKLEERIAHVSALNIRPLSAEEVNRYALEWQETQREFVDQPLGALQKADRLIQEVMRVRGFPVEDFEQRAADLSVYYSDLVTDYRGMHRIAIKEAKEKVSTEEMRQAMVHGRTLFENLLKQDLKEEVNQKERI